MLEMIEMYHFENDYLFCHKQVINSTDRLKYPVFQKKNEYRQFGLLQWLGSVLVNINIIEILTSKKGYFSHHKQGNNGSRHVKSVKIEIQKAQNLDKDPALVPFHVEKISTSEI